MRCTDSHLAKEIAAVSGGRTSTGGDPDRPDLHVVSQSTDRIAGLAEPLVAVYDLVGRRLAKGRHSESLIGDIAAIIGTERRRAASATTIAWWNTRLLEGSDGALVVLPLNLVPAVGGDLRRLERAGWRLRPEHLQQLDSRAHLVGEDGAKRALAGVILPNAWRVSDLDRVGRVRLLARMVQDADPAALAAAAPTLIALSELPTATTAAASAASLLEALGAISV